MIKSNCFCEYFLPDSSSLFTNLHGNSNLSAMGSGACPTSGGPVKSHHCRFAAAIKYPVISHKTNKLLMYNLLCIGLSNPLNASKNAYHQFSDIYNCYVQCIFHLVRKRLKDDPNLIQLHSIERPFYRILAAGIVKEDWASRNAK